MSRILVVDDDEQQRYLSKVLLERYDHEVVEAENGVEALELARRTAPDLLLTDILMPDMDGFTLCREWKRDSDLREIPVIFHTATYTDKRDEELALSVGAARFIRKPSEPADVVKIVEQVLSAQHGQGGEAPAEEVVYLRNYSAALVRKLEDKVEQLERTQASVDQATIPIVWVSDAGRITYANDAAKQALGRPDVSSADIWDLVGEISAQSWRSRLWDPARQSGRLTLAATCRRADSTTFPAEITASPWERAGDPQLLMFIADITERRVLEARLARSRRLEAMSLVAGGVAHDFNNFLTVISSALALLRFEGVSEQVRDSAIEEAEAVVERAARLTQQLLTFGREEVIAPKPIALNQVIEDNQRLLEHALGPNSKLALDLSAEVGDVLMDQSQLERILVNLVVNARDALPDGGLVRIETATDGDGVSLVVSDTGVGIDAETRERVFEPYFTTKENGTGLGLSTIHGIVEQNGWEIDVDSEPGRGTRIEVRLPAVRS